MKLVILTLIILTLLQTVLLPVNLVLLLILARSLVTDEKSNLWLAFLAGILLGLMSGTNLGFWAVIFLVVVKLVVIIKQLPIQINLRTVLPISLGIIVLVNLVEWWFLKVSLSQLKVLTEVLLSLPIYLIVGWWEERFVVAPAVKLKLRS